MKNLMLKYILLSLLVIIANVGFSNSASAVNINSQVNNAGDPIPGLDISLESASSSTTNWR